MTSKVDIAALAWWRKLPPKRMTLRQFEELPEYSSSNPTGAWPGKMWRRHNGVYDANFLRAGGQPRWIICTYEEHPTEPEKYVKNGYYRPVITQKMGRKVVDHLGRDLVGGQ